MSELKNSFPQYTISKNKLALSDTTDIDLLLEKISKKYKNVKQNKIDSEVLQNIPVTISVEVGRTSLKIRDLMRLAQGSVVELDRLAGEPLDLMVNNTLVAQGEVVLVNDRYGVKLTSVVPTVDRVKNL